VVTPLIDGLLALQLFQVLFLGLHDWVPLGRFNDVKSVQAADPRDRLIRVTLISTLPYAFGLAASLRYAAGFPGWLIDWLWVTYALLFVGQLRAWWLPYLLVPDPVRAARYRTMFGHTHGFLPERNGITPNTLHIALHVATLATLILLAFLH
jgi:hypothetical protein